MSYETRLFRGQEGLCFYCSKPMDPASYRKPGNLNGWTRDHFIPQVLGGKKHGNIVLAHVRCNSEKSNRLPKASEIDRFVALRVRASRTTVSIEGIRQNVTDAMTHARRILAMEKAKEARLRAEGESLREEREKARNLSASDLLQVGEGSRINPGKQAQSQVGGTPIDREGQTNTGGIPS